MDELDTSDPSDAIEPGDEVVFDTPGQGDPSGWYRTNRRLVDGQHYKVEAVKVVRYLVLRDVVDPEQRGFDARYFTLPQDELPV